MSCENYFYIFQSISSKILNQNLQEEEGQKLGMTKLNLPSKKYAMNKKMNE